MPGAAAGGRPAGHRHGTRRRRDLLLLSRSQLAKDVEVPQLLGTRAANRHNELTMVRLKPDPTVLSSRLHRVGRLQAAYLIVSSCADAASSSIASRSSALATRPISVSASPYCFCSIASRTPGIVFTA